MADEVSVTTGAVDLVNSGAHAAETALRNWKQRGYSLVKLIDAGTVVVDQGLVRPGTWWPNWPWSMA